MQFRSIILKVIKLLGGFYLNRKIVSAIILIMVILMFGCSNSKEVSTDASKTKKLKIMFVSPMTGHPVWLGAKEGLDAAAKEFAFDGIWAGADDHSVEKTVEAMEQAVAEKPDAIVMCPFAPSAFTKVLEKAKAANIPVVVVAVDTELEDLRKAYIGTNSQEAGRQMIEALQKKVGDNLKIGVIMSNFDAENQVIMVNSMKEYIKNVPGATIVDTQENRGDQVKAIEVLTAMIKAHPEMNAVFGVEGGGPPGYAKVLEELNLTDKITVIGMDDVEQNLAVVREGKIYGIMAQDFYKMGYLGAKYAMEAAQGKETPSITDSGVTLVTKENIDSYKNQ
jgi:ABC-type sugar transport system substrate-binding protein